MITLIAEPKDYSKKALAVYRSLGPVYFLPELKGDQKDRILKSANILALRLAYKIDKTWLNKMPNLKIIAALSTGLNHIDLEEVKRRHIKVFALKGQTSFLKNIPSTAEEALALIMALVRNIPWAFDDVKKGNWNRDAWKGHQLIHKTLGLLGCGRLGNLLAKYGKILGMRILGADPNVDAEMMKKYGIKKVDMRKLFKESDILSIHVSLEPNTYNLVQEKHLKIMKPTAYLINTSRGEIIDEKALFKALKQKWIAGAALDVLRNESSDGRHLRDNSLIDYARKNKNLLIVPRIGGATYEAMQATEDFIADLVREEVKK